MAVRPIDGNKLIEWFRPYLHTGEAIPADVVIEDIRSMPTLTPLNEWVSVEEKLPEPGERVLATDCGFVGEFYINERGQWQRYNVNCHALLMALDILYWMPLPAAPDRRPPEGKT